MDDWLPVPQTDAERAALVAAIQSLPAPIEQDLAQLGSLRGQIAAAASYEEIRGHQGAAESIRLMARGNQEVRRAFDYTYLAGEWRVGRMLLEEQKAQGGEPYHQEPSAGTRSPEKRLPTLAEKVGNRTYGWRLMTTAQMAIEGLNSTIDQLHGAGKDASLTGIVKILRAEESEMRRLDSMTAPSLNSMDLRVGDCRVALSDIESNSLPLIMTDPPYEDGAEPLWRWLGEWAMDVLIPGGSLICYFGGANINKLYRIFDDAGLTHWWPCVMMHEHAQRLAGKFVTVNAKPVLWYVKEFRRGRTLVPDVVYSARRNKAQHAWGQGEGGITQWIHQLTEPGETIVDPFCGSGEWGLITCREGRKWIGCDIVAGGTTQVVAHELDGESANDAIA